MRSKYGRQFRWRGRSVRTTLIREGDGKGCWQHETVDDISRCWGLIGDEWRGFSREDAMAEHGLDRAIARRYIRQHGGPRRLSVRYVNKNRGMGT